MHRLVPIVVLFFVGVPAALAWTWPVRGPVVQAFDFDRAHPYTAGQHRGIAIAAAAGTRVRAPVGGTVSFAGTVPGSGPSLTIRTEDGLAVTLTTLGSLGVARGDPVAEGDTVATAGGDPVHLGVREAASEQGYLDPLRFLPLSDTPSSPAPGPTPAPAAVPAPAVAPAAAIASVPASPVATPVPAAPASSPTLRTMPADTGASASAPASSPAGASAGADAPPSGDGLPARESGLRVAIRPAAGLEQASSRDPAVHTPAVQAPAVHAPDVHAPALRAAAPTAARPSRVTARAVARPAQPTGGLAFHVDAAGHPVQAPRAHSARPVAPRLFRPAPLHAQAPSAPAAPGRPVWHLLLGILASIGAGVAAVVALS